MSNLAAQIVFHPTINRSLKLWSTTVGRDKTYRTIQYFSRFLAWYLLRSGNKVDAARFNALKSALGSGRKLMRLFKPLEHAQAALKAAASSQHPLEAYTTIGRQLGYFGYLTLDMIVWANSIRFLNLPAEQAKKINLTSQRFWISGLLFSITNSIVKSSRISLEAKRLREGTASEKAVVDEADRKLQIKTLEKQRGATRYQLLQDSLDIWLPATNLEFANLNDGVLGAIGTITSIMALRLNWAKTV